MRLSWIISLVLGILFAVLISADVPPNTNQIVNPPPRCPRGYQWLNGQCRKVVENECGEIPTVLVQNKMDLVDQCVIDPDEAERLGRALGCKLMRTSVKEDVGVVGVFKHLASRCIYEMRRYEEEDEFRLYSSVPHYSPTPVISAFSPNGSLSLRGRNPSNGTIVLRATGKMRHHKKRNIVRNACRLL